MRPARTSRPGDRPVLGPLAAARISWDDWQGVTGVHLVYSDLDLAERRAVTAELGLAGESDDHSIVVESYRRWGDACAVRLGGQFAFAVWDGERDRLVAFRDTIGFRPLVYSRVVGGIVVGGDIRSLLDSDGVSDDIDEDVFVAAVLSGRKQFLNLVGRTCYSDIALVRPAHVLIAAGSGVHQSRYWHHRDVPVVSLGEPEAYVAALREIVTDVVDDLTPRDGVIGSHLSGALDSSAVISLASKVRREAGASPPVALVSAREPDPHDRDDRIDAIAEEFGLDLVYVPTPVEGHVAEMLMDATREPSTSIRSEHLVRESAVARGVTTVISGHFTDSTETIGFPRAAPGHRRGRFRSASAMVRQRRYSAAVRTLARPAPTVHHLEPSFEQQRRSIERYTFLDPRVLRRAALPRLPVSGGDLRSRIGWMVDAVERGRRITDWNLEAARSGVRYRFPMLDRRLLRFWLSLPADVLESRGEDDRWMLRRAMEGAVPDTARLAASSRRPIGWYDQTGSRRLALDSIAARADLSVVASQRAVLFEMDRLTRDLAKGRGAAAATLRWIGVGWQPEWG